MTTADPPRSDYGSILAKLRENAERGHVPKRRQTIRTQDDVVANWGEETGRDFFRLLSTIYQFRRRFGRWPSVFRADTDYLEGMEQHYLTPHAFQRLKDRLTLIAEDNLGDCIAEDGNDRYSYANNPLSQEPAHDASIWLWGIRM